MTKLAVPSFPSVTLVFVIVMAMVIKVQRKWGTIAAARLVHATMFARQHAHMRMMANAMHQSIALLAQTLLTARQHAPMRMMANVMNHSFAPLAQTGLTARQRVQACVSTHQGGPDSAGHACLIMGGVGVDRSIVSVVQIARIAG
jgi:hypothetical protein